ncbi:hypothetical protein N8T08_002908 [Aspergillus melleus]|uniref:Uncharacterized protein n=1 Tax=Aspergillus melleus TaxID=138277 RepID=A0ACC3B828_9EURO|nr:hypothetical protein N8T08_002908 [Aspergillus melleus]
MTITTLPASAPSTNNADLAILSVSRLLIRLEHNLLSPGADLIGLRTSEFQRMRVGANIEHARSNLHTLERNIPATKPLERRHTLQTEVQKHRETLKRLQALLEEISAEAEVRASSAGQAGYEDLEDEGSVDGEDFLGTPEESGTENELGREEDEEEQGQGQEESEVEMGGDRETKGPASAMATATATATPVVTTATTTSPTSVPTAALRNRHMTSPSSPESNAKATGFDHPSSSSSPVAPSKGEETEQTLSTHRAEQEDLTSSLLSLASQLKSSSQAFQTSLDSEKSVLARAVDGLDRTTGNMQAAERRMGMLRRMTEGKGWWGRMMLYAWILGLWVVAVLIVFLGPKLRF